MVEDSTATTATAAEAASRHEEAGVERLWEHREDVAGREEGAPVARERGNLREDVGDFRWLYSTLSPLTEAVSSAGFFVASD